MEQVELKDLDFEERCLVRLKKNTAAVAYADNTMKSIKKKKEQVNNLSTTLKIVYGVILLIIFIVVLLYCIKFYKAKVEVKAQVFYAWILFFIFCGLLFFII